MAKRKRYYQSKKDRMAESRGMKRYEKRMRKDRRDESRGMRDYYEKERMHMAEDGYYKMDPRRRRELEDSGMIHEDHYAPSNLPQQVMHKYWGGGDYGLNVRLDDTDYGVDRQKEADNRKMYEHLGEYRYRNIP